MPHRLELALTVLQALLVAAAEAEAAAEALKLEVPLAVRLMHTDTEASLGEPLED